jgi:hypothetical protein
MDAKANKLQFYKSNIFNYLLVLLIVLIILTFYFKYVWLSLVLAIVAVVYFRHVKSFTHGLEGEADVSDQLRKLPPEFSFVSDISIGGRGNIDKIVFGPTGVWVLEVKSHQGRIRTQDPKFIKQVWAESYAVRNLIKEKLNLDITVQPVLVFSSPRAKLHFGFNKVEGVYVIGKSWLNDLIIMHPVSNLDRDIVSQIQTVLRVK